MQRLVKNMLFLVWYSLSTAGVSTSSLISLRENKRKPFLLFLLFIKTLLNSLNINIYLQNKNYYIAIDFKY